MRHSEKYALVWPDGRYSVGDEAAVAKAYLKRKGVVLGLLRVSSGRLVYSLKVSGQWRPQGTIADTGNYEANRRAALRDFFRHTLLTRQDGYSIVRLVA